VTITLWKSRHRRPDRKWNRDENEIRRIIVEVGVDNEYRSKREVSGVRRERIQNPVNDGIGKMAGSEQLSCAASRLALNGGLKVSFLPRSVEGRAKQSTLARFSLLAIPSDRAVTVFKCRSLLARRWPLIKMNPIIFEVT
jgi:hypothetical protein